MIQNLTDSFLKNVRATDDQLGRTDYRDAKTPGLVFRVSKSAKSWSVIYRRKSDGKRRRVTIGEYPDFSLADARTEAKEINAKVARGEDPAKAKKRPSPTRPRTFGELAKRYVENHASQKRSGFDDERRLNKNVLPDLEGEPLEAIERADITSILDRIVERGAPIEANRTFAVIRKVFNWAIEKGYMEAVPITKMKMPAMAQSRSRILTDEEIRIFWRRIIAKTKMDWEMRAVLKLCLLTGQRVMEIAGAKRSEIDLIKNEWHMPGARIKNAVSVHIVPLSPLARLIFVKAMKRSKSDEFIFPSRITGQPMVKTAPSKAVKRNEVVFGFDEPFTPHDLRRTLASGLGQLGFNRLIQDKVLNHITADRSISAVYDRYAYLKEKREALETWADHLQMIVFDKPRAVVVSALSVRRKKSSSPWAVV
jgi:integrase